MCHCGVQFTNINSFFPFFIFTVIEKYVKTAKCLTGVTDEDKVLEVYNDC